MAKYRRLSRTMALQTLTALLLRNEQNEPAEVQKCFDYIKKEFAPELAQKDEFAKALIDGVLAYRNELDEKIVAFAPEWPVEKLSSIERLVLELGSFELIHHLDTPLAVVINEWVDIAKEFGDETAGKFINGVLSSIARAVRSQEKPAKQSVASV